MTRFKWPLLPSCAVSAFLPLSLLFSVTRLTWGIVHSLAAQPAGAPEISKMSSDCGSVEGGAELFIIGKNFMKGTKVTFDERQGGAVVWSKEAELDPDYFHPVSILCLAASWMIISSCVFFFLSDTFDLQDPAISRPGHSPGSQSGNCGTQLRQRQ